MKTTGDKANENDDLENQVGKHVMIAIANNQWNVVLDLRIDHRKINRSGVRVEMNILDKVVENWL